MIVVNIMKQTEDFYSQKAEIGKENKYDDEVFFEKYAGMTRSRKGLEGAGEWSELKGLLPDFKGKRVLDLGCGYGWHCIYAAMHGAKTVTGLDISHKMLQVAKEKNSAPNITYTLCAIEDALYPKGAYDVVLSSLALHYVADFPLLADKIYHTLTPGGQFVFSVEHPVFTAYGSQDWYYSPKGEILHFPVDNYYYEGQRQAVFLGEKVIKYHRTLTTYLDTLLQMGFVIKRVVEPKPPENMLSKPGMKDEMRRPMMLLVCAQKSE